MKKLIALLLSLAMLAGLFACAPSELEKTSLESSDPVATEPGDVKTIGIAIYAMTVDSCVAVVEGVQHAAKERGWKVNLQDANADPSTQAD